MHREELAYDERMLRVRLAADPASVPGARRFVADGLRAWGHEELVDDATLCVSELAGNAALHDSSSYIEVGLQVLDSSVRVFVEDDGAAPASAVMPRTTFEPFGPPEAPEASEEEPTPGAVDGLDELDLLLLDQPATGRGLAIVSVLASDWGVEELATGKRVWADLGTTDAPGDASAARSNPVTPGPDAEGSLPPGWTVVWLTGCPVELSLRQDQHLDELVRELSLMAADGGNPASTDLSRRLEAILRAPTHARLAGRHQAEAARARGERLVDVEMAIPKDFTGEIRRLHDAVKEADVLCDEQRLLTLSSPAELRDFRTWMTEEITGQVERGAQPTTWDAWRSR